MRTKCVCALMARSKGDISKGSANVEAAVQAHKECRGNSLLWGMDYESWPKGDRNWTHVANSYLD